MGGVGGVGWVGGGGWVGGVEGVGGVRSFVLYMSCFRLPPTSAFCSFSHSTHCGHMSHPNSSHISPSYSFRRASYSTWTQRYGSLRQQPYPRFTPSFPKPHPYLPTLPPPHYPPPPCTPTLQTIPNDPRRIYALTPPLDSLSNTATDSHTPPLPRPPLLTPKIDPPTPPLHTHTPRAHSVWGGAHILGVQ